MARTNEQYQVLEGLIEVMTELFKQNSYSNSPAVNPPTPSLNNLSQTKKNRLSFTEAEMSELKDVLTELDQEGEVIETEIKNLERENNQHNEKPGKENNESEELKAELKDELKSELKNELKPESEEGITFKETLAKHSSRYDALELTIQSGEKIKGVLSQVKADFIVLIDKDNDFVKIPIDKILSVKKVKEISNTLPESPQEKKGLEEKKTTETQEEVELPAPEELLARELVPVKKNRPKVVIFYYI